MKTIIRTSLMLIAFASITACNNTVQYGTTAQDVERTPHDDLIAELIAEEIVQVAWEVHETYPMLVERYMNHPLPAWSQDGDLTTDAREFMSMLENANMFGLDPASYGVENVLVLRDTLETNPDQQFRHRILARVDLYLTSAFFRFGTDLHVGIIDPETLEKRWKIDAVSLDLIDLMNEAVANKEVTTTLRDLQPDNPFYRDLQAALEMFVTNHDLYLEPTEIPNFREDSIRSYELAEQVLLANLYMDPEMAGDDQAVVEAVKVFQQMHGLTPDGLIGKNTAIALSRSNLDRYQSVAVTLERWKWNEGPAGDHLFANIPGFHVMAMENDRVALDLNIIVGTQWNQTPEMVEALEYMEVFPFWNVPYSIAVGEILPKVKNDPNYLTDRGFKVFDQSRNEVNPANIDWENLSAGNFDYKFRKDGGSSNDLGLIKFMFPNSDNIYMHDTPNRSLFANDIRSYSHGCVRVEDPFALAAYLLEREEHTYTRDSLETFVDDRQRTVVTLQENLPVYIGYYTCEGDKDMSIRFFQDIYGRDLPILNAMFGTPEPAL